MKKIFNGICLFAIMFAMLFALTACGPQKTVGSTFIGGTEGLKETFMTGSPPDKTIDGGQSSFAIVVKLENIGESDIKASDGYVRIIGLEPSNFNTNNFKKTFTTDITGAKKNYDGSVRGGGVTTVEFGDLKYLPTIQGDISAKIWADICYKYTTKITTQVCVKKDAAQSLSDTKICQLEGEKTPQNSGAPIQITSLKESFAGNGKVGLTITIAHSGKGDSFFKDTDSECNDVETNGNRGKVHVQFKSVKIAGRDVYPQCSGLSDSKSGYDGYIRMYRDTTGNYAPTTLYCTLDASSTDSIFEVPLEAEFTYLYLQHITKDITIQHVAK